MRDEGPGIMNPENVFVPFFTTKPGGSGIGLALSRQIAEAHSGSLSLANRKDRTGCEALLRRATPVMNISRSGRDPAAPLSTMSRNRDSTIPSSKQKDCRPIFDFRHKGCTVSHL